MLQTKYVIDNVVTKSPKASNIILRIRPDVRDDFKIAADLRGATMSGLIHQFIYKTIREEKESNPQAFEPKDEKIIIGASQSTIEAMRRQSLEAPRKGDGDKIKKTGTDD